ncbi:MAG: adenylate/guanylate cyclase domain-containing response regulator [Theionarchaea archaeon]|nr:adenylate/guanylate cyclase domain-containing response regulator [Theionarchaea archaeon]
MPNILVVDDRQDILESYKLGLDDSKMGWDIFTAENEKEAENMLSDNLIDVVITDLVMLNERSGIGVLEKAKKKDPLIMVLIVTAYEKKLDRYEAFEKGAFDCIARNIPDVKTIDEIIVKTKTALKFRELAKKVAEIERKKTESALKRYFDPVIWEIIKNDPKLLKTRRKTITIVFWDIRGFSKLCDTLKDHPTWISEFLKEYFEESSQAIFSHKGILDKFMGDKAMSLFGVFDNGDDNESAISAVGAAIEMQRRFDKLKRKYVEKWQRDIPQTINIGLGCGIHAGEVLVGNMGTEDRYDFTAIGAHVNFARRIEKRAKDKQILISVTTKQRIQQGCKVNRLYTWDDIKNISGEFDIFEVVQCGENEESLHYR